MSSITTTATQEDLQHLFEKFGRINRIHLGRDRRTNESRGFAFINYANRDDAQRVIITVSKNISYFLENSKIFLNFIEFRKKLNEY